jgi:hypothetical protein
MSERERIWRDRIAWQQQSGMTVAECCDAEGVSVASFYRWKKLLSETGRQCAGRGGRRQIERPPSFVPITLHQSTLGRTVDGADLQDYMAQGHSDDGTVGSLRVELPNGVVIHLPRNLDGQRLGDVILAAGQIEPSSHGSTADRLQRLEIRSC